MSLFSLAGWQNGRFGRRIWVLQEHRRRLVVGFNIFFMTF
jgi:hypothetical protein